jgi:hypothetical protein
MSDIDVEDVVEAVALAEANSSQTRSVALSLAFSERYSAENDEEDDVHQVSENGVTLNGIASAVMKNLPAII